MLNGSVDPIIKGVIMGNNQMFVTTIVGIVVAVAIAMIVVWYFL